MQVVNESVELPFESFGNAGHPSTDKEVAAVEQAQRYSAAPCEGIEHGHGSRYVDFIDYHLLERERTLLFLPQQPAEEDADLVGVEYG